MSPSRNAARGQAAAMMALTMMLISLMVCLTLGIGMKIREKAETQTLADTAAYSQAVVTARTFNSIAILNRVEVAEMVSVIATESLVSYASYYRAMVWSAREQFAKAAAACGVDVAPCNWCTRFQGLVTASDAEIARIDAQWTALDSNGNNRVNAVIGASGAVYGDQKAMYDDLMNNQIVGTNLPPLANNITGRVDQFSQWQGELTAPASVTPINQREIGLAPLCDPAQPQGVCEGGPAEIPIKASMGTRWYQFERDASNLSQTVQDSLIGHHPLVVANGDDVTVVGFQGSSRFVDRVFEHAAPGGLGVMGEAIEGQLQIKVTSGGCGPQVLGPTPVSSWVYSTSFLNANDGHAYGYVDRNGNAVVVQEAQGTHALNASCDPPITPCGMWPGFMDMNPGHVDPTQKWLYLYGQPKLLSVVQRDYRVRGNRADPWNLLYHINIRRSDREEFDNNGIQTAAPLDISKQTAIATGLVYYHRQFHWKEPPNFFNPHWRATLVSNGIDQTGNPTQGGQDLITASGNAQFAKDVITNLAQQGFRGW